MNSRKKRNTESILEKDPSKGDMGFTHRKMRWGKMETIPGSICMTNGTETSKGTDRTAEGPELPG